MNNGQINAVFISSKGLGGIMKRVSSITCFLLITFSVCVIPYAHASNGLVESGISYDFKAEITFVEVLDDGTVLTITDTGIISCSTLFLGVLTPLWTFDLNNSATYAKLDSGQKFLAVIHESGFLTFDIENQEIGENITLNDVPDSLDWDTDGDIWIAYHSGIRKAREYRNGQYNFVQTSTISSGFFSFEVTESNHIVIGGFDSVLHIFDQQGNLITQRSEPTSFITILTDLGNGVLVCGSGDGRLHYYDYNNTWSHTFLTIGSEQLISFGEFNDTSYFVIDGNDEIHLIDKTSNIIFSSFNSNLGSLFVLSELSGQISVIINTGSGGAILFYDLDTDGDGISDSLDDFPNDSTQQYDTDGDGYGDNPDGFNGDAFPNNPEQYVDSDNDGYGDNQVGLQGDLFPENSEQWEDLDGDGFGDNSDGYLGDRFIDDATQWNDSDGDGYGDNPVGNSPDACPDLAGYSSIDRYGCIDSDFDFYSDPDSDYTVADGADALPNDGTQWNDIDGDGYGENPYPATNPDSCPSVAGNSTKEIRLDGTVIDKLGCLDSDGDSFDDLSDEFPSDPTEWFDSDGDGKGSNSDYDDTEFLIVTEADYCRISGDQSTACISWNDLDYQDYLARDKAEEESDLSYPAWLAQKEAGLLDEDEGIMGAVMDVAVVGGGVFVVATVLILLASFVIKKRKINDLVKRYGVPFEPKKNNSVNEEALEGTAGLSATGGIESDDSWDDDIEAMDFSEKPDEVDEGESTIVSADELYSDESDMSELAGIEFTGAGTSGEEVSEMLADESEAIEEKPSNVPPVPESGLPEGWTMEQWEWYGHEWLAKYGEK